MGILLKLVNQLVAYSDANATSSNPLQRLFDFERRFQDIPALTGRSESVTIAPGDTLDLFSGVVAPSQAYAAGVTALTLSRLSGTTSTYRLAVTAGPGAFRTSRSTAISSATQITVTVNNNAIATFSVTSGSGSFSSCQVGDVLRIRGPKTGDLVNNIFAGANSGYWTILSVSPTAITAKRRSGQVFDGVPQVVTIGSTLTADQLRVYSTAGVQPGQSFILSGTLSPASQGDYSVLEVGPTFVDFVSPTALPEETGVLLVATTDLLFYSEAQKLFYIEADKEIAVRLNGDISNSNIVSPIEYGEKQLVGFFNKWGFTYSATIVNRSPSDTVTIRWFVAS